MGSFEMNASPFWPASNLRGVVLAVALASRRSGREASLHLASQMRHNADQPFDQHQLAAVVHFVFLDREDHLETALGWRIRSRGHLDLLGEESVGKTVEPASPFLPIRAKQLDGLILAALRLFFRA